MIGAFARKFGGDKRVHEVVESDEDVTVVTRGDGLSSVDSIRDDLPEQLVERLPTEAGEVVLVPFLDRLRAWTRRQNKE